MDILSNELNSQFSLRKIEKENIENNEIRDLIYKINKYSEIPQNIILNNFKSSKEYEEKGIQSEEDINKTNNINSYFFKEKSIPINNKSFNYFKRRSKSINYNDEQIKMNINQNYYNNKKKDLLNITPYSTKNINSNFDYKNNNNFNTHINSNYHSNIINNYNYNNNKYQRDQYSLSKNLYRRENLEYEPKKLKENFNAFNKNTISSRLKKMGELYNINKIRKYPKIYMQQPTFVSNNNNENRKSQTFRNELIRTNKEYSKNFLFQNQSIQKHYN